MNDTRARRSTGRRIGERWLTVAPALLLVALSLFAVPVAAKPPAPSPTSLARGGLTGADGRVEAINAPARISRVAVVPGTNEFWAIGHVTTSRPGWDSSGGGQLVFLRNSAKSGWTVEGPPVDPITSPPTAVNPKLTALALTADGEGWAVGLGGVIVHKAVGSPTWEVLPSCSVTCNSLDAITLVGNEGFAVGGRGTVLVLKAGTWSLDTSGFGGAAPALTGVAAVRTGSNTTDVWAIASSASESGGRAVEIWHRGPVAWTTQRTGWDVLDTPLPTLSGSNVRFGVKGKTAAADGAGNIWFAGSLYPLDPANPTGDPTTAGSSERPFTLRLIPTSPNLAVNPKLAFLPYCPLVYTLSGDQTPESRGCGEGSGLLPLSAYPIVTLAPVGNDLFAGGFGLYHFSGSSGTWFREPDPIGSISSVAFSSIGEGWFASAGDTVGSTLAQTSSIAVGHYTTPKTPPPVRVARWSDAPRLSNTPLRSPSYSVALPPSGSAPPIAIGERGTVFSKGVHGWSETGRVPEVVGDSPVPQKSMLSVAYAGASGVAWAVGEAAYVSAIRGGVPDAITRKVQTRAGSGTTDTLYSVAFSGETRGWAVGANGALVRYNAGSWTHDQIHSGVITKENLYSVDAVGAGFVAVGAKGTILVNPSGAVGGWSKLDTSNLSGAPALYAVDGQPGADTTFVAGGARSTLVLGRNVILADPTKNKVDLAPSPHEGTLLALAARKDGGVLKLIASLAPHGASKFAGAHANTTQGWLMSFDGSHWVDLQRANRTHLADELDYAMTTDAIFGIAADPDGRSGWAVGGRLGDLEGPDKSKDLASGSIYRFDLDESPQPPTELGAVVEATTPGYNFAFFSDTSCGATLCTLTAGTGTTADEVMLRIRDDINAASERENGPKFVLFGGSSRGSGTREEIAQFAAYLSGFKIPVFGAPGARDLAPAVAGGNTSVPALPYNLKPPVDVAGQTRTTGSNRFYQEELAAMPQPWGTRPAEAGFLPVGTGGAAGRARTHYAVDYKPSGAPRALGRFVFLDTSTRSLAANQNPPEPQGPWLTDVLLGARSAEVPIPTFVVMNTPPRDPSTFANDMILPPGDVTTIENATYGAGTTAVFAGGVRTNAMYRSPDGTPGAVPYYVAGTGGAPLTRSKAPTDGHYHSWLLATVDPSVVSLLQPQAKLTVRTIPVIESVSLVPKTTLGAEGGSTLEFNAIARALDGGGPWAERDSANRRYLKFPVLCRRDEVEAGGGISGCFTKRATVPDYRFISEDPATATFVRRLGDTNVPLRSAGRLLADATSGLLCTFRTGQVWVRVESGGRQARLPVTVVPGRGPCVGDVVIDPIELPADVDPPPDPPVDPIKQVLGKINEPVVVAKPAKIPAPTPPAAVAKPPAPVPAPPQPEPTPVVKPVPKVFLAPQPLAELMPALMPPAPSMLPSPAPPASASAAGAEKEEEREVEHEGAGQEGGDFVAISHHRETFDPMMGWMLVSVASLLGLFGAAIAATMRSGRHEPARAAVIYPRGLR